MKFFCVTFVDASGGAGLQADLKTFAALGVYGTTAVTAVTALNTRGVFAVAEVPEEVIAAQIDVVRCRKIEVEGEQRRTAARDDEVITLG